MTTKNLKKPKSKVDKIIEGLGKKTHTTSAEILQDGTILEMVYDKKENTSSLVVFKDDAFKIQNSLTVEDVIYKPHSVKKDILKSDVVLFPSEPIDYKSQTELIAEIQTFIHKYLAVSDFFEKIATYYVLFSWIHDDFKELPYLRGLGDYGTGKSRFLKVVGSICYKPIFTSGATTVSPIFRLLNEFKGTLIMDEADLKYSDTTNEMIKILNCGFMEGMPVLRSVQNNKNNFDTKSFVVFGPKIIATRELFKDEALESRMITEDMNLNHVRADIPYNIPESFSDEALALRNKLLMFRLENKGKTVIRTELEDRSIEPRLNQIAIPLMSIIDDEAVIADMKKHITEYSERIKSDRSLSYNYQLLEAICKLLDSGNSEPTIGEIADKYNEQDLENIDFDKDRLTPKKVGYFVRKKLDLKTIKTRRGFVVSKENSKKIKILRQRYGIEKFEGVNDVNNVNDNKLDEKTKDTLNNIPW